MQLDCGLQALGGHMGTYTTNKELFMPSVGETGWGDLVNGNFSTIDTYLKPISLSENTYTFTGNQTGGSISATSITNSGTLTQTGTSTFTGKIDANGGINGKINVYESGSSDTIIGTCNVVPQEVYACASDVSSGTFTIYEGLLSDLLTITQKSTVFDCKITTYSLRLFAGYTGTSYHQMPGTGYSTIRVYENDQLVAEGDGWTEFSKDINGTTIAPININSTIKITYTALKAMYKNDSYYSFVELKSNVENFYL